MKKTTLKDFWNSDPVDGYYAVWISDNYMDANIIHGFSGAIFLYTDYKGFEGVLSDIYPEWLDKSPEESINVLLIEELPE